MAHSAIGASLKQKNTQPLYIFNRENPQNYDLQNGPRSGLDYIALPTPSMKGEEDGLNQGYLLKSIYFFVTLISCH